MVKTYSRLEETETDNIPELLLDLIQKTETDDIPRILLLLHFEKSFDTLN